MADMLHATASEIRAELKTLDARRARLRKLLAIAEEDEGKAPAPKPEAAPAPDPKPEAEAARYGPGDTGGLDFPIDPAALPAMPLAKGPPPPAKAETQPPRRGR